MREQFVSVKLVCNTNGDKFHDSQRNCFIWNLEYLRNWEGWVHFEYVISRFLLNATRFSPLTN